jgi:hypothetical protein
MNRAKLTGLKLDMSRHGVPWQVIQDMTKDQLLHTARKIGVRDVDKARLAARRRRLAPQILKAQRRKEAAAKGGIFAKVKDKIAEAFGR